MLLLAALFALLVLVAVIPRLLSSSRTSRDIDRLGPLSDRWLAEHRSSRQQQP